MIEFLIIFAIFAVFIIGFIVYAIYEEKLDNINAQFRKENEKFYNIAEGDFGVDTSGRKIRTWDTDHTIDFIINHNAKTLLIELHNYEDLKTWWRETMPTIMKKTYEMIDSEGSRFLILKGIFKSRAQANIAEIHKKYDPQNIKFRLKTYSLSYSQKHTTFNTEITPEQLRE